MIVLYIGGEGRSGSTLLASMLGQQPGFCAVGEMRGVWRAVETNELCGCGAAFSDCEFWRAVGAMAFGEWSAVDLGRMLALDDAFVRHRRLARIALPAFARRHAMELDAYRGVLAQLYRAVARVSGCQVVVDSTKDPSYAFLLRRVGGVDLRVAHLVRDSRGVVFSWSKEAVPRPEYALHPELSRSFMERRGAVRAALLWSIKNLLFHLLSMGGTKRIRVAYEALVESPAPILQGVLRLVGEQTAPAAQLSSESGILTFSASPQHSLGGNRVRFTQGLVPIRVDNEWREAMAADDRLLVTLLSWPLLAAYGYSIRG